MQCTLAVGDDASVDESTLWVHMCGKLILDIACGAWVPEDRLDMDMRMMGYKAALEERRSAVRMKLHVQRRWRRS